jgi:hypothetical protein
MRNVLILVTLINDAFALVKAYLTIAKIRRVYVSISAVRMRCCRSAFCENLLSFL